MRNGRKVVTFPSVFIKYPLTKKSAVVNWNKVAIWLNERGGLNEKMVGSVFSYVNAVEHDGV